MKTLRELLPPRQFQVAGLIRYGMSNPEIAQTLGITRHTVQAHVFRILESTGCDNRTTLAVRYALENQVAAPTLAPKKVAPTPEYRKAA